MEITLKVQNKHYHFFLELIQKFTFVEIVKKEEEIDTYVPRTNEELKADLREAFAEVKLYKEGKIQLRDAREALNEL
jgi:hypothetical protein